MSIFAHTEIYSQMASGRPLISNPETDNAHFDTFCFFCVILIKKNPTLLEVHPMNILIQWIQLAQFDF
jgi:hypothetical protein